MTITTATTTPDANGKASSTATTDTGSPATPAAGESFRSDELLPIRAAMKRLGWGSKTLAAAKRKGLHILCFGARSYLLGADVIAFLKDQPVVERHGGPGRKRTQAAHNHKKSPADEQSRPG